MADETRGHLVFSCSGGLYGVPAAAAAEVVNLPLLTAVPGAPRHLMGVFAHRGEIIPVVDLSVMVGNGLGSYRRAVLLRHSGSAVAFAATKVVGVLAVAGALDVLGDAGVLLHLRGVARCSAGALCVLDVGGLVTYLMNPR
jgi:purine-binding chemotaxis protein CheW